MTHSIRIPAFLAALVFAAAPLHGEDWYRWRGPSLNGVSNETDWNHNRILDDSAEKWNANVGTGFSSLVVSEGVVFTSGNRDEADIVFALDAKTGHPVWKFQYDSPLDDREFEGGPTSTPTVDGDSLFVLGRNGDLFCLDKQSGKKRWGLNLVDLTNVRVPGWGFSGSPLIIGDTLVVNAGDSGVAFRKQTGDLLWSSADKDCGYGTPVPWGDEAIIVPSGRSYVAVNTHDGKEIWRQRWLTTFGCNAADPIVSGDEVFLSSGYNRGAALLSLQDDTPTIQWKSKSMQNQISASILVESSLYGVHGDMEKGAALVCMDLKTGDINWSNSELTPGAITASPTRLVVLSANGELVILKADRNEAKILARKRVLDGKCWTSPVLSNSTIYCRNAVGDIVAVDVQK